MVQQYAMPITVIAGETQRAPDGLALSSRNSYLSEANRAEAVQLSLALRSLARDALATGEALPHQAALTRIPRHARLGHPRLATRLPHGAPSR